MTTMTENLTTTTHTLDVPGAVLTYDVRKNESSTETPLMIIGSPMAASGFGQLADHFRDRTVVTYDPRGTERSKKTDGTIEVTRQQHADDVHAVIQAVGGGPVDLFASSGGAVNALALVARYPNDVRTLVAHEPPNATVLPDRDEVLAAIRDMGETYQRSGFGAGMAKFIALTSLKGPIPADFPSRPTPDPATFGMPTEDDGSRDDPLLAQNVDTTIYEPDFDELKAAPTRIVIAAGAASEGQFAYRGAMAIAERLGTDPVIFPGGHAGFLKDEWGPTGDPDAFAAKLHEVLEAG